MKKSDEIRRQIADHSDKAQAFLDVAEAAGRELTADEDTAFKAAMADIEALKPQLEASLAHEAKVAELRAMRAVQNAPLDPVLPVSGRNPGEQSAAAIPGTVRVLNPTLKAFKGASRDQAVRDAYDCGLWFKAVAKRDEAAREKLISRRGQEWFASQNEGVGADGGYLVPAPLSNAVTVYREQVGVLRQLARIVPMSSDTFTWMKQTSGTSVYYPGEEGSITASDANFSRVSLTAKKRAILAYVSNELKDDAIVSIMDLLASDMGHQFALKEDEEGIKGDGTSTYGGVQGIRPAVIAATAGVYGPVADEDAWDELTVATHLATMSLVADKYRTANMRWLCSASYKWQVMDRLAMAAGGSPAQVVVDGVPQDRFLGYPVVLSDRMPTTTGVSQVSAIFGDFSQAVVLGDRNMVTLATSEHVGFTTDQIAVRGTCRYDINVHEEGDTSTAGAIVGLATHS